MVNANTEGNRIMADGATEPNSDNWSSFGHDVLLRSPAPATPTNLVHPSIENPTSTSSMGTPASAISELRGGETAADLAFLQAQLAVAIEHATAAELQCAHMHDMLQQEISTTENSFEREALVKAQLRMAVVRIDELSRDVVAKRRLGLHLPDAGKRLLRRFRAGLDPTAGSQGANKNESSSGSSQRRPRQQPPAALVHDVTNDEGNAQKIERVASSVAARPPIAPLPVIPAVLSRTRSDTDSRVTAAVGDAMAAAAGLQRSGRQYTQVGCGLQRPSVECTQAAFLNAFLIFVCSPCPPRLWQ